MGREPHDVLGAYAAVSDDRYPERVTGILQAATVVPAPTATRLSARGVARLTRHTARQLRYLADKGIVVPSVQRATQGTEALYAPNDLFALLVIERVRAACGQEIRIERLRGLVDALLARSQRPSEKLVTDGDGFWVEVDIDGTLRRSVAAIVVDLDAVAEELTVRLRRAGVTADLAALAA